MKKFTNEEEFNVRCKCGAKRSFLHCKVDVLICHICGRAIYRNDKVKFRKEMEKIWKHKT